MKKLLTYLVGILILFSCTIENTEIVESPIAKVNDKYLYPRDLKKLFRQSVSPQDSVKIVKTYVDNWVDEQLMLSKAEMNLTIEEKDVQEKLTSYRNSLLIYKYQENYIKQNLDTLITIDEISKYYEENTSNFMMENNLVKALYIKVSSEIPWGEINQLVRWLNSSKDEDERSLYDYCSNNAENFDDFDNEWVAFNMIEMQFPDKINRPESTLKWKKFFQAKDTAYYYYLKINDFVPKNEVAPLEYIDEKIKSILINKRKITLIKKLESEVYNEAMNRDMIKIY